MSSAKQTKLSFSVGKRTTSGNGKSFSTTPLPSLKPAADTPRKKADTTEDDGLSTDDIVSISSNTDEEGIYSDAGAGDHVEPIAKRTEKPPAARPTRLLAKKSAQRKETKAAVPAVGSPKPKASAADKPTADPKEPLVELKVKDARWKKLHTEVAKKAGNMAPIHGEGQNKIHEILRIFDNCYEYGPCVGVTRLERWNRAKALGLNPPKEIEDILQTKQGATMVEYSQSVYFGEV